MHESECDIPVPEIFCFFTSVPESFSTKKSTGSGTWKNGAKNKYRNQYLKNLAPKKGTGTCLGTNFGYCHTVHDGS